MHHRMELLDLELVGIVTRIQATDYVFTIVSSPFSYIDLTS